MAIKAEYFALICGPCLEQLSDKMRMGALGTCKNKNHIKVHAVGSEWHYVRLHA